MLAQSFMTAAELHISEEQLSALIKTLSLMDTGKIVHVSDNGLAFFGGAATFTGGFNMGWWTASHDCGTAACIGGTAELIGNVKFGESDDAYDKREELPPRLADLFFPDESVVSMEAITVQQAAMALRSYLTTGDARWDLALADQRSVALADTSRETA